MGSDNASDALTSMMIVDVLQQLGLMFPGLIILITLVLVAGCGWQKWFTAAGIVLLGGCSWVLLANSHILWPHAAGPAAKQVYKEGVYREQGVQVASLQYYAGTNAVTGKAVPILVFAPGVTPAQRGRAKAVLLGPAFHQFMLEYGQWLPALAQYSIDSPQLVNPTQATGGMVQRMWQWIHSDYFFLRRLFKFAVLDAIEFIQGQNQQRQLNINHRGKAEELAAFTTGVNQQVPDGLPRWVPTPHYDTATLMALYTFGDHYKGLGACSVSVDNDHYIRLLDWPTLGAASKYTYLEVQHLEPARPGLPRWTASLTLPPGIGLTVFNDKQLLLSLNEATTQQTVRHNQQPGAIPQFALIETLAAQAASLQEIAPLLATYQPASSHLITARDKAGNSATYEMLPLPGADSASTELYRRAHFAPANGQATTITTNHFSDAAGQPVTGSAAYPNSWARMQKIQQLFARPKAPTVPDRINAPWDVDTMQVLVWEDSEPQPKLYLTWTNRPTLSNVHTFTGPMQPAFPQDFIQIEFKDLEALIEANRQVVIPRLRPTQ